VNKIPSVSLLNNASLSNLVENNILSFLNDNLNNNHKSRNVNKVDKVYNNCTNAVFEPSMRIIQKENDGDNRQGDSSILSKVNNNDEKGAQSDYNKIGNTTFKKEEKKISENLLAFTSYTNTTKKNDTGSKPLFVKKNPNKFLESKNAENSQYNPIVLIEKNTLEKNIKYVISL
jgi:hypothetical protein